MAETASATPAQLWHTKEGTHKVADFLRGRGGMPVRHGIEMDHRVDFFRADRLIKFLIENKSKSSSRPAVSNKTEGLDLGFHLLKFGYIHRVHRDETKRNVLKPHPQQAFVLDGYYVWMYEGSKTTRNVMTTALIIGFICITMFPAWPVWMKVALWYVSVTLLCFIVLLVTIRLFLFFVVWMVGYDFWFLPNLFDETLSVADSFRPIVSLEAGSSEERYWRIGAIAFSAGLLWWIGQQPHDIDEYMSITKQFTEDLYSGKLLTDVSEQQKQNIDKPKAPTLEELLAEENQDIFSERDDEAILDQYFENQLDQDESEKSD